MSFFLYEDETDSIKHHDNREVSAKTTSFEQPDNPRFDELSGALAGCKLLIGLAPQVPAMDVAWEDYHHQLACRFGLVDGAEARQLVFGPRYLLASNDQDWAIQELVAALEAMDCPIEAL